MPACYMSGFSLATKLCALLEEISCPRLPNLPVRSQVKNTTEMPTVLPP